MTRGLYKLHNAAQTIAAKEDWQFLADYADRQGLAAKVDKLTPPENWGWKRIDRRIAKLKEALRDANKEVPKLPSEGTSE
jgi:hypothetical protein